MQLNRGGGAPLTEEQFDEKWRQEMDKGTPLGEAFRKIKREYGPAKERKKKKKKGK